MHCSTSSNRQVTQVVKYPYYPSPNLKNPMLYNKTCQENQLERRKIAGEETLDELVETGQTPITKTGDSFVPADYVQQQGLWIPGSEHLDHGKHSMQGEEIINKLTSPLIHFIGNIPRSMHCQSM
uniref:Uncharacterized protein n=1 Tax=Leersia perrieri TaxID=77586 RepID=A0A0D9V8P5_9ORYZ